MSELPDFKKIEFPSTPPIPLEEVIPNSSPEVKLYYFSLVTEFYCSSFMQALDLVKKMLVYNSKNRISANEVLMILLVMAQQIMHLPLIKRSKVPVLIITVEPPNKGHFGTCHFVHYREVVLLKSCLYREAVVSSSRRSKILSL